MFCIGIDNLCFVDSINKIVHFNIYGTLNYQHFGTLLNIAMDGSYIQDYGQVVNCTNDKSLVERLKVRKLEKKEGGCLIKNIIPDDYDDLS